MTPGQTAYEECRRHGVGISPWNALHPNRKAAWEAAAAAVLMPYSDTIQSLQAADFAGDIKLTVKQAWAVARWHDQQLTAMRAIVEPLNRILFDGGWVEIEVYQEGITVTVNSGEQRIDVHATSLAAALAAAEAAKAEATP
jgi:hypothetical protein